MEGLQELTNALLDFTNFGGHSPKWHDLIQNSLRKGISLVCLMSDSVNPISQKHIQCCREGTKNTTVFAVFGESNPLMEIIQKLTSVQFMFSFDMCICAMFGENRCSGITSKIILDHFQSRCLESLE